MEKSKILMIDYDRTASDADAAMEENGVIILGPPEGTDIDNFIKKYPISQSMPSDWYD